MVEKDDQKLKKEITDWVSGYYFNKAYLNLRKAMDYSERCLSKAMLISFGLLIVYLFLSRSGHQNWSLLLGFLIIHLTNFSFFRRRKDKYWQTVVPSAELLKTRTEETVKALPSLNREEKKELQDLIRLRQNKFVTKEIFRKELEKTLEFEGLRKWGFLQEFSQQLNNLRKEGYDDVS